MDLYYDTPPSPQKPYLPELMLLGQHNTLGKSLWQAKIFEKDIGCLRPFHKISKTKTKKYFISGMFAILGLFL
jgi:hypothetical protein